MIKITDPWIWISAMVGIGAAFCLFPINYRYLKMRAWFQKSIDQGGNYFLFNCGRTGFGLMWGVFFAFVFILTPMLMLKPFEYMEIYIVCFVSVLFFKSFAFRRRMIALGLDPKTEERKRRLHK